MNRGWCWGKRQNTELNCTFCCYQSLKPKADYKNRLASMYCYWHPWMDKEVFLSTSLLLFQVFLMGLKHRAPECHQLPWGQCPKPWISNPAPPQVPLRPSLASRSSAWIQGRTGAALWASQSVSMDLQRACVIKPSLPWAAQLQTMCRQGWRRGEKPEHQQTNSHSTIPKDGKFVAVRLWSQSHTGWNCESKTIFPKVCMIRLSP